VNPTTHVKFRMDTFLKIKMTVGMSLVTNETETIIMTDGITSTCAKKSGKGLVAPSRCFGNLFLSASGVRSESLTRQVRVSSLWRSRGSWDAVTRFICAELSQFSSAAAALSFHL
jgi:hypothetical protein